MPKVVDHEARRTELLDVAFENFAERGYAALSMRGLASAMGVTTGLLYHYFPSKEVIFEQAMMQRSKDRIAAALDRVLPLESAGERMGELLDWLCEEQVQLSRMLLLALDAQRAAGDEAQLVERASAAFESTLEEHFPEAPGLWTQLLGSLTAARLSGRPLKPANLGHLVRA